jgi:hypothetical protein
MPSSYIELAIISVSSASCNYKKGTRFPDCSGEPCLIDPSSEDPATHIEFLREGILGKTRRGQETIESIGLDRSSYDDERARWLFTVDAALLLCLLVPGARETAHRFLIWAMQPDAPYSAMTWCYLRETAPGLANPTSPHPHVEFQKPAKQIAGLVEKYKDQLASELDLHRFLLLNPETWFLSPVEPFQGF